MMWKDKPIQVITKSGGFGPKELFDDLNKQIIEQEEQTC